MQIWKQNRHSISQFSNIFSPTVLLPHIPGDCLLSSFSVTSCYINVETPPWLNALHAMHIFWITTVFCTLQIVFILHTVNFCSFCSQYLHLCIFMHKTVQFLHLITIDHIFLKYYFIFYYCKCSIYISSIVVLALFFY